MYQNFIKSTKTLIALFVVLAIQGCVSTQKPIPMDLSKLEGSENKMAIIINELPQPYTHKIGSQGLLDIAINNAAASTLTKHVKSLDVSEFLFIRDELKDIAANKGLDVVLLDTNYKLPQLSEFKKEGNFAKVDYTSLKTELGADQLLIVNVSRIGTERSYYGFIPISTPSAVFDGTAQLIDLSSNQLYWHHPVNVVKPIAGKWDEKPSYPTLTKVIYEALEQGKLLILDPLKKINEA